MVSLHRKRRRVSKSHMARGGNLTTLNRERRVAKIAKVANARRVLAESAAKSAKADAAAAVVATACSEESIDLTALAAVNALIECSRPHLPGRRFYRPRLLWVGCGRATEALTLFAIHGGGGHAKLVEVQPQLAHAAHMALATRAGKPDAPFGEELVVHGWHVRVVAANILVQQPEFFVGFSIYYTFAGPKHHAVARCVAEAAFANEAVLVTTTQHLVTAGLTLRTYWPAEEVVIVKKRVTSTGTQHFTLVGVVRPAAFALPLVVRARVQALRERSGVPNDEATEWFPGVVTAVAAGGMRVDIKYKGWGTEAGVYRWFVRGA